MKKLYTLSFILAATLSFGQTISFTGTGALTSNGWTSHSGTAGQQTILTGSLSYTGLAASTGNRTSVIAGNTEDVNYPTSSALTGTVYYSTLIKVLDAAQLNLNSSTGDYSLAFTSVASTSTTAFQARIYIKQGTVASNFTLGILNNSGGTAAPTYITSDLTVNTTYLLVVKYDLSTNAASLYVNPVPGNSEPTASATNTTGTTVAPAQIAGIIIRQGGTASAGTGNVEIDEIRIGSTWASVTPKAALSVKQNEIAGLSIYPNPVNEGTLYITSDSSESKAVTIFDLLGKQVLNSKTENNAVNISSLKRGSYIVKITENGKTATQKIIIE